MEGEYWIILWFYIFGWVLAYCLFHSTKKIGKWASLSFQLLCLVWPVSIAALLAFQILKSLGGHDLDS